MEVSISDIITRTNQNKGYRRHQPVKIQIKKPQKAWENAADQFTNGFRFASNWPKGWRGFSKPITDRRNAKSR